MLPYFPLTFSFNNSQTTTSSTHLPWSILALLSDLTNPLTFRLLSKQASTLVSAGNTRLPVSHYSYTFPSISRNLTANDSGIPKGTPIADQFMGGHSSGATGTTTGVGSKLDNSLDHYSSSELTGATSTGHHSSGVRSSAATGAGVGAGAGTLGSSGKEAVSGQYAGSGTKDALTGQSECHSYAKPTT